MTRAGREVGASVEISYESWRRFNSLFEWICILALAWARRQSSLCNLHHRFEMHSAADIFWGKGYICRTAFCSSNRRAPTTHNPHRHRRVSRSRCPSRVLHSAPARPATLSLHHLVSLDLAAPPPRPLRHSPHIMQQRRTLHSSIRVRDPKARAPARKRALAAKAAAKRAVAGPQHAHSVSAAGAHEGRAGGGLSEARLTQRAEPQAACQSDGRGAAARGVAVVVRVEAAQARGLAHCVEAVEAAGFAEPVPVAAVLVLGQRGFG